MPKNEVKGAIAALTRTLAGGAVLGGLVACFVINAKGWTEWQSMLPFSQSLGTEAEALTPEAWPICTTMASLPTEADWVQLDPDFKVGKRALSAADWNGAIAAFQLAALRDPLNPDIQNYIGYSYRRLRQLGPAIGHYQRALMLNPRHRGAHEHLGEAYLVLGEPAKAEQQLAALDDFCLLGCQEYDDLKHAIAAYKRSAAP